MYKVFNTGFQYDFMRMERKDFYTVYFVKDEVKIPQEIFYTLKEAQERCDELNKLELSKITAQEMFEKLGYKMTRLTEEEIQYKNQILHHDLEIYFDLVEKNYNAFDYIGACDVTPKLHQAITQQMKELGWIE